MELRTLRYLVEIAEEKSINRAAEKLYVSQPTLSRAIQALERELGFAVLERTNHAGRAVLLLCQIGGGAAGSH